MAARQGRFGRFHRKGDRHMDNRERRDAGLACVADGTVSMDVIK